MNPILKHANRSITPLGIVLILSAFTHLWNPVGFPDLFYDEGVYMRRAMHVLNGLGPQESYFHDHPFFGQLFLAGVLAVTGYPNSLYPAADVHSIEMLYLVPRLLMGMLAVIDTFLVYKISQHRYNRNVALFASILFAVMPVTWLFRRILIDSLLLPFLLSSILFALYADDSKNKDRIPVLLSGIFLGLAIFTKIPIFTMIPLVGFLIRTNGNSGSRNLKTLVLWFIPVILIPLIWPAQSLLSGQFDLWLKDVLWQTQRQGEGLSSIVTSFFMIDPILLVLGSVGLVYAAIKRDLLLLLWAIPFVIFLSVIAYVQYFYWIPILPAFCIGAARLIVDLSDKIRKKKLQQILLFAIISGIGVFGLVTITMLITTHVSSQFEATAYVAQYVRDNNDSGNSNKNMTIISSPVYSWIFSYVFHKDHVFSDYRDLLYYPVQTEKVILIADQHFKYNIGAGEALRIMYNNTRTVAIFRGGVLDYDLSKYPYTSMSLNYEGSIVEIRIRE